nr:NADH dehydrogenase subunit 2 [Thylacodes adamsii]
MFTSLPYLLMFGWMMFFSVAMSVSSFHWLGMWAGAEVNLICFIPFIIYSGLISESESAVKYFIFQAVGSAFLAFGSLLSFSLAFTWELMSWNVGVMLLMLGLLTKLGAAPFHWWFPDVMSGMAWPVALILTTWQKIIPLALMSAIITPSLVLTVALLGSLSALVGGVGGMNQTHMKALLAYSSIGHMGWLLYSISSGFTPLVIYFISYVILSVILFWGLWTSKNSFMSTISGASVPAVGAATMLCLLSMGGLPPLLGFMPKWFVFIQAQESSIYLLMAILILGSLLSIFYYLALTFILFISNIPKNFSISSFLGVSLLVNGLGGAAMFFLF